MMPTVPAMIRIIRPTEASGTTHIGSSRGLVFALPSRVAPTMVHRAGSPPSPGAGGAADPRPRPGAAARLVLLQPEPVQPGNESRAEQDRQHDPDHLLSAPEPDRVPVDQRALLPSPDGGGHAGH